MNMLLNGIATLLTALSLALAMGATERPNILLIYADDIGYGDLSCYGGTGVQTPNVDALAKSGLKHLSGYSSSSTCTPSRYSLLTGQYAFRNEGAQILPGSAPLIIDVERPTIASVLKGAGYRTALVGKWHLGLGKADGSMDWNGTIGPGPLQLGFDKAFFLAATGDRVPSVFIDDDSILNLDPNDPISVSYEEMVGNEPTGISHPELLRVQADRQHSGTIVKGISRIGYMAGGESARFRDEDLSDRFLAEAIAFIEEEREEPFFLYFATHENHVPRMPHPRFQGASSLGPRGDAIAQFDWSVGKLVEVLKETDQYRDTLIIITSDNGPVLFDGYWDGAEQKNGDHQAAGPYRGGKYSVFEGGTRSPMIVHWPERVKPGESEAIVSQMDFLASLATLAGVDALPTNAGKDGQDVSEALLGKSDQGREYMVQQGMGSLAIRAGDWKYIPKGVVSDRGGIGEWIRHRVSEKGELYNLKNDPGETEDVRDQYPKKADELRKLLDQETGRTF